MQIQPISGIQNVNCSAWQRYALYWVSLSLLLGVFGSNFIVIILQWTSRKPMPAFLFSRLLSPLDRWSPYNQSADCSESPTQPHCPPNAGAWKPNQSKLWPRSAGPLIFGAQQGGTSFRISAKSRSQSVVSLLSHNWSHFPTYKTCWVCCCRCTQLHLLLGTIAPFGNRGSGGEVLSSACLELEFRERSFTSPLPIAAAG